MGVMVVVVVVQGGAGCHGNLASLFHHPSRFPLTSRSPTQPLSPLHPQHNDIYLEIPYMLVCFLSRFHVEAAPTVEMGRQTLFISSGHTQTWPFPCLRIVLCKIIMDMAQVWTNRERC